MATSDRPEDDVIAETVADAGIECVRGPLDDPLRRFAIAATDLDDEDVVVRLTADNVVPDGIARRPAGRRVAGRCGVRAGGG